VLSVKQSDLDDLQLPRKRLVPARIDIGRAEQFQFTDVKSLQRAQVYEAVDKLIATIDWRLDEQSLKPAYTLCPIKNHVAT